jgi:hypothetical protein
VTNEKAKTVGSIKKGDVAVRLHTMVQSKGVSSTGEVTKTGGGGKD